MANGMGNGVIHKWEGSAHEGPFVNGKRHGHWIDRWNVDVDWGPTPVEEVPYVDGKRHGHWKWRTTTGNFEEGPYVGRQKTWALEVASFGRWPWD